MIRSSAECTVQPDGFSNWISLIDYDSPNNFDYCKDNDYYIYIYIMMIMMIVPTI